MSDVKFKKGFTLIELLVVISIISLLSSVVFASLNSARSKARDAKRLAEIRQIELALEFYFDANGAYPSSGGATDPNASWSNSAEPASWAILQPALAPYLPRLPVDPMNTFIPAGAPDGYAYYYTALGSWGCNPATSYLLVYRLENGSNVRSPGFLACDNITVVQYGGGGLNTSNASGIITKGIK